LRTPVRAASRANNNEENKMTRIMKLSVSALSLAAGVVMLGAGTSAPAQAGVIYYGDHITYREAKRMCDGIHGRVFLGDRDRYGCQNQPGKRRAKRPPPPPPPGDDPVELFSIKKTSNPGKRQNFTGRQDFPGMIGHQGGGDGGSGGNGGGGNGGGNGGGSAGGPY
jgi:uncharacterized membrane protein YgcG